MRGRPPLTPRAPDMLDCLRRDPGTRTFGELIQERQWAVGEIERLRTLVDTQKGFPPSLPPSPKKIQALDVVVAAEPSKRQPEYLRTKDVCAHFGFSPSTLYLYVKQCGFPSPIKVGVRAVRWRYSEVEKWIESRGK